MNEMIARLTSKRKKKEPAPKKGVTRNLASQMGNEPLEFKPIQGAKTVEDYLMALEPYPEIKKTVESLIELIRKAVPDAQEGIKFRIPFYSHHGFLVYINPQKNRIALGFCQGQKLQHPMVIGEGRLSRHIFFNFGEKPKSGVYEAIIQAALINEENARIKALSKSTRRKNAAKV
ncbi:MAG: DUF1801 domain-containing protein [Chloroherpetonaceae bacterium]|nr:DUF1801 domain-containing protein [Chloroherpetonaceae bacterium]